MLTTTPFKPHHINATKADLAGNNGIGRYIFLPGSDGRAKEIAEHFEKKKLKAHPRGHNLYLGTLECDGKKIDVAAISSGMGCPSTEIIVHELYHLGAKRFLRIGTAGNLQPAFVKTGDLINVQASVRDEDTSRHYVPIEMPAVAALEFVSANLFSAEALGLSNQLHTGIVHCKSALYAREFAVGPHALKNQAYLTALTQSGVLATEMESAILFLQAQIYNYQLRIQESYTPTPQSRVLAGAILGIIGSFEETAAADSAIQNAILLALETIKTLAVQESL